MSQEILNPDIPEWEDELFSVLRMEEEDLRGRTFLDCRFTGCRFLSCRMNHSTFRNCVFEDCELSLPQVAGAAFSNVEFQNCRLQGINFEETVTYLFYVDLTGCDIRHCYFGQAKLNKRRFTDCRFRDCGFHGLDLQQADFSGSAFTETSFSACDLRKADFTGARGYGLDPQQNKVKGAVFSAPDVLALLAPLGIKIKD